MQPGQESLGDQRGGLMISSKHPFPASMLSNNIFTEIDVSFSKFQPRVNFCDSF